MGLNKLWVWSMFFVLCAYVCTRCAEPKTTMPLSLTGSKAVFEKVSIYAADIRNGASTASELAEEVTWTIRP